MSMAAKRKPEPMRTRLTVPAADGSVIEWLELQDDPSGSMRKLIRDSIEREGFTDAMNKPVAQLPRRGRPPVGFADGAEDQGDDDQAQNQNQNQSRQAADLQRSEDRQPEAAEPAGEEEAAAEVPEPVVAEAPKAKPVQAKAAKKPQVQIEPEAEPEADDDEVEEELAPAGASSQVDMGEIFGHNN